MFVRVLKEVSNRAVTGLKTGLPSPENSFLSRRGWQKAIYQLLSPRVWKATLYLISGSVLGVFWFVSLFTLILLGVGLAYTLVGLVILIFTQKLWIIGAKLERVRVKAFLGVEIVSPYRPVAQGGWSARIITRQKDVATWKDLLYLFLLFPLGLIEGLLVFSGWMFFLGTIILLAYVPVYCLSWGIPFDDLLHFIIELLLVIVPALILGLYLLWLVPYLTLWLARFHGTIAQALLGPGREKTLTENIEELRQSRDRILEAALLERQRIERDLHDGAQQKLVAIGLTLAFARDKITTDPQAATLLVDEAHRETKQVVKDIRNLVRGVYPAVLTDRGLDAAISALTGQSPVPVTVETALPRRLPERIEATAYFVIGESLTNIFKHSQATKIRLKVYQEKNNLMLEIYDNGIGGAVTIPGGGLAGLTYRVEGLYGRLQINSPVGGPTLIRMELPCE